MLKTSLLSKQDLTKLCSPIEDQGQSESCTPSTGIGLVEYFERRAYGKHIAALLFLNKVTRKMLNFEGDTSVFLGSAIGA